MAKKPGDFASRRKGSEENRINANRGRIDLRLQQSKQKALKKIKKLQLPQTAADLKKMHNLSADRDGFGTSILQHELQRGFLKSMNPVNPKEQHCLKLLDNTLRIERLLRKHEKQIPLKEAAELYQAAYFILEIGKIAVRGNAGKFDALSRHSAKIAESAAELQAAIKMKEIGSVILKPGNFLQIAVLGDSLLKTATQHLKPEIRFGFAEIDRIAGKILVKGND